MDANSTSDLPKFENARALPAPPVALWTFAALLLVSALWAIFNP